MQEQLLLVPSYDQDQAQVYGVPTSPVNVHPWLQAFPEQGFVQPVAVVQQQAYAVDAMPYNAYGMQTGYNGQVLQPVMPSEMLQPQEGLQPMQQPQVQYQAVAMAAPAEYSQQAQYAPAQYAQAQYVPDPGHAQQVMYQPQVQYVAPAAPPYLQQVPYPQPPVYAQHPQAMIVQEQWPHHPPPEMSQQQDSSAMLHWADDSFQQGGFGKGGNGRSRGYMQFAGAPDGYHQNGMYPQGGKGSGAAGGGAAAWKGGGGLAKGKNSGRSGFAGGAPFQHEGQTCDLFVGRLADWATSENIRQLFSSVGLQIRSLKVPADLHDQPKGYAFVSLADPSKTDYAIEQLHGRMVNGRPINVEPSALTLAKGESSKGKGGDLSWALLPGRGAKGSSAADNNFGYQTKGGREEQNWAPGWGDKGRGAQVGGGKGSDVRGGRGLAAPKPNSNPHKLFVGNLTAEATSEDVVKALQPAGEIVGVRVLEGKFSGIAFVEFKASEAVDRAVGSFQGIEICGRAARLERQGGGGPSTKSAPVQVSRKEEQPSDADLGAGSSVQASEDAKVAAAIAALVRGSDNHDVAAGTGRVKGATNIGKLVVESFAPETVLAAKTSTAPSVATVMAADADAAGGVPVQVASA